MYYSDSLRKIPGIVLYGEPEVSVIAFGSNVFDIYELSRELSELPNGRGWALNNLQYPPAVHLCVTDMHTAEGRAEGFLKDVSGVARLLCNRPKGKSSKGVSWLFCLNTMSAAYNYLLI